MYYFRTEKLSVGYDGKPLIKDVEFGIDKGSILVIVGPNGAGKTTVLKSIAGQLSILSGCVYIDEKDMDGFDADQRARTMGALFTDRIKSGMITVYDVVSGGRYPYTGRLGLLSGEDDKIVFETMKLVGIEDICNEDFFRISDGQKQRVMLARALCRDPEILILDEPTSFLDIRHKLEFLSVLEKMRERKKLTVIMSVHELDIARSVADRVLCLKGDKADRFGTPDEVFDEEYIRSLYDIGDDLMGFAADKKISIF